MSLPYPPVYDFPYMSPVPSPSYCFFHLSVCPSAYLSQLACLCSLSVHLPSYSVASPYLRSLEFFSLSAFLPFFLSPCLPLYLSTCLPLSLWKPECHHRFKISKRQTIESKAVYLWL